MISILRFGPIYISPFVCSNGKAGTDKIAGDVDVVDVGHGRPALAAYPFLLEVLFATKILTAKSQQSCRQAWPLDFTMV